MLLSPRESSTSRAREAVRHEIIGDLETDALVGPSDEGYEFVLHGNLRGFALR